MSYPTKRTMPKDAATTPEIVRRTADDSAPEKWPNLVRLAVLNRNRTPEMKQRRIRRRAGSTTIRTAVETAATGTERANIA